MKNTILFLAILSSFLIPTKGETIRTITDNSYLNEHTVVAISYDTIFMYLSSKFDYKTNMFVGEPIYQKVIPGLRRLDSKAVFALPYNSEDSLYIDYVQSSLPLSFWQFTWKVPHYKSTLYFSKTNNCYGNQGTKNLIEGDIIWMIYLAFACLLMSILLLVVWFRRDWKSIFEKYVAKKTRSGEEYYFVRIDESFVWVPLFGCSYSFFSLFLLAILFKISATPPIISNISFLVYFLLFSLLFLFVLPLLIKPILAIYLRRRYS
jgi:hypothetical protein